MGSYAVQIVRSGLTQSLPFLLTTAIFFFLSVPLLAQMTTDPWPSNKVISLQGSPYAYLGVFELRLKDFRSAGLNVKVGLGKVAAPDYYGSWYQLSAGYLFGRRNHHLDIDLGPGYFITNSRQQREVQVIGHLGYRYQRPAGLLVVKVGAGYPEALYLGLGLAF